jgi:hypothetical protein
MPISIAGSGTITGISAGGLPDDCITTAEIAANAVTTAKLGTSEASGLAKAWVNFNGTGTVAIRASYNVSSITDSGTGNYTVNFTSALTDTNYCAVGSMGDTNSASIGGVRIATFGNTTFTTSACAVLTTNNGDTAYIDVDRIFFAVFR